MAAFAGHAGSACLRLSFKSGRPTMVSALGPSHAAPVFPPTWNQLWSPTFCTICSRAVFPRPSVVPGLSPHVGPQLPLSTL
jgi:hypothetical protein